MLTPSIRIDGAIKGNVRRPVEVDDRFRRFFCQRGLNRFWRIFDRVPAIIERNTLIGFEPPCWI